jgi:hypothetical protein
MKTKTTISYVLIALLYVWTWYGGYLFHSANLTSEANQAYSSIVEKHEKKVEEYKDVGLDYSFDIYDEIHRNGPRAGIDWCFPIIPGILIVKSYYSIGPSLGAGGVKIVLFYGAGTIELLPIFV